MTRDTDFHGKTVDYCEAFTGEESDCFQTGRFGVGFRIVFTDGTSLEIQESGQAGGIQAWLASDPPEQG